jgi:hypothetical protein
MGGGATGNSSAASLATDVKQAPKKSTPNTMALVTFSIFE